MAGRVAAWARGPAYSSLDPWEVATCSKVYQSSCHAIQTLCCQCHQSALLLDCVSIVTVCQPRCFADIMLFANLPPFKLGLLACSVYIQHLGYCGQMQPLVGIEVTSCYGLFCVCIQAKRLTFLFDQLIDLARYYLRSQMSTAE